MSGLENKFSVYLVCEDVVYGALLRKNITYKELVGYVRKKFSINHTFDISFHYEVGSSVVRIDDDNDVEFFGNEVYNSLATTSHKLFVKKGDDFDNKEHCMYVIGKKALDKGFEFKGTYKGINLVLVGMDGNNQIIPITIGVSQGETIESWIWFLLKFKECIDFDANKVSDWATHKVMEMQKSAHWTVLGIDYGIPCGHVIVVRRKMGCTDYSHLALGWFRKITLYSTYQDLVYPVREPSSWVRPDGLQVVKPPNMNFHTMGKLKNTDHIKSQGEEPIQVKRSRCGVRGHNRTTCHEPIENYQDSTQPRLKRSRQTRSQEYEAAYTNNYVRSQEYEAAYTNNYVRSQEYEATYTNNYVSTQECEATYNNMDGGSQGYQSTYNNMNESLQGYEVAYTNFNNMFEQPNINFGGQSQHPLPTKPFTFSQFNSDQSPQQTYSIWDSSWDPINLANP
uniref:Transposase, MuDR, MULE transposase domain protein n=1 Tax=Tanacetum cinerariifolium TaxID=118510 RepID=A0A699HPM7_TANCI|nr:hypothetical protein [Tanacetum cinerariifolium]